MRGAALAAAVLVLAACGDRTAATRGAVPPAAGAATPDADAVDRLRSLGYVGFTPRGAEGSGVVRRDRDASWPGYTLFTNRDLCSAALVDEDGAVKNHWSHAPCGHWSNAELLASGELIVPGAEPARSRDPEDLTARRYLLKLAWDGRTVWKRPIPAHHDVEVTPSGHLLTLVAVYRKIPAVDPARPVRDNQLALLSAEGVLLETASLYDLFAAAPGLVKLQRVKGDQKREVDLFHANSVEWLRPRAKGAAHPLHGPAQVLVSVRHQDAAVVVDWAARRLVWAWGQGEVSGPHDATMLENGNILLFDNGLTRRWSRVVEVDPAARRIVWEYRAPEPTSFFTVSRGSNQRLPNGNTLIAQSDSGRAFEVTPSGRVVWDFWNPFGNDRGERATIVRAKRYERAQVDGFVRRFGEGRRQAPAGITAGSPASAASPSAAR
jgi:hypothetical protein